MSAERFWQALDCLLAESEIVIERPAGTTHPRFCKMIYPFDYGYLCNTSSMDGQGIDIWIGESPAIGLDSIAVTVDLLKRDSEIKLLYHCDEREKRMILEFHNNSEHMKAILIRRPVGLEFGTVADAQQHAD